MGFDRLDKHLTQHHLNQLFDASESQTTLQLGRGVLEGCQIEAVPCALQVIARGGIIQAEATKRILDDIDVPLPAYSTRYVWRDENSRTILTETPEAPGGMFVCVGRVITGGDAVLQVDGAGRYEPPRVQPDNPRSWVFRGEVLPKGPLHHPVAEQFLDDDLELTLDDRNVQVIDPGWAFRVIKLPAEPHWGNWFRIINISECHGGALFIYSPSGALLGELDPGQLIELGVKASEPEELSCEEAQRIAAQPPSASARKELKKGSRARTEWYVRSLV
jgi:hypothetical protein